MSEGITPQTVYCPSCKTTSEYKPESLIVSCPKCGLTVTNPFSEGSVMECIVCGAKQTADGSPKVRTDWRCVNVPIGGRRTVTIYACAKEFPADGGSVKAFEAAYVRMLRAAQDKLGIQILK